MIKPYSKYAPLSNLLLGTKSITQSIYYGIKPSLYIMSSIPYKSPTWIKHDMQLVTKSIETSKSLGRLC